MTKNELIELVTDILSELDNLRTTIEECDYIAKKIERKLQEIPDEESEITDSPQDEET